MTPDTESPAGRAQTAVEALASLHWAIGTALDDGRPEAAFSALILARQLLPAAGLALDDLLEAGGGSRVGVFDGGTLSPIESAMV